MISLPVTLTSRTSSLRTCLRLRFSSPPLLLLPGYNRYRYRYSHSHTMEGTPTKRINNQVIFLCDMQEKFRNAIWQFDKILLTTQKVLRAAKILQIPVIATTQNSAKLGGVVHELRHLIGDEEEAVIDKTRFSMLTQEVCERLLLLLSNKEEEKEKKPSVVIVGIESHICVTQTALDLCKFIYLHITHT
ncbi:Isochorismatase-like protein, partial [Xylariaceae sp. FL0594]